MGLIRALLMLVLVIVGVMFAALNAQPIDVNYLIGMTVFPLSGILLIAFILGSLLSFLILSVSLLRLKAKNKWLAYKLKQGLPSS